MSEEMQKAFEENAARASEAESQAFYTQTAAREELKAKRRKAARQKVAVRVLAAAIVVAGLWLATRIGLIALQLALPLEVAFMLWAAVWFGAWLQYRFGKVML